MNITPVETPASGRITVDQLAQGIALIRTQPAAAAATEPEAGGEAERDAGAAPAAGDQSQPEAGADPNALWNQEEAEAEPEGDGETAPEGTDAESQADSEEPEEPGERGVRKLQKRVNKLTAELRATQEALRKANEAAATPAGGAEAPGPVVQQHPQVQQLESKLTQLNAYLAWARENEAGGEYTDPASKQTQYFDEAAVRRIRENVELARTEVIAEKAQVVQELRRADAEQRKVFEAEFRKAYGNLDKATTPEGREFQSIVQAAPWIKQFANWQLVVGDAIRGRKARELALKKAPSPQPRSRFASNEPAPVAARPVAGTPPVDPGEKGMRDASERFSKSGRVNDLASVIAARRAAGRVRA